MRSLRRLLDGGVSNRPRSARLPGRLLTLGGALAVAAGLVGAAAPVAAAADSTTYLDGVTSVGNVVAAGGRIFVAANDRIVVADSLGNLTGDITGLPGAVGLAIRPDGSRLYAALRDSNEVVEIRTDRLRVIRRIDLSGYLCPSNLSLAGDRLWVGFGCGQWGGGVISLDLSAAAPQPVGLAGDMYGAPLVAAAGNTVVIGEAGLSPGTLRVYDVSATMPALRGVISGWTYNLSNLIDLAITPDGSMAISAFGSPYQFDGWDTTTLTRVRSYGADASFPGYPQAVTVSPDGAHIAGGRYFGQRVSVYDTVTGEQTYTGDNMAGDLVRRSLTFSGDDVVGVLNNWSTGQFYLWRMDWAALPGSTLTVTGPSSATALEPLTLTGRLTLADGTAPGTQLLQVTRRLPNGTSAPLDAVTTQVDGTFTVTDTPPAGGAVTYDVRWQGNSVYRGSSASVTVTVAKRQSSLTLTGPATGLAGRQLQFSGILDLSAHAPLPGSLIYVLRTVASRNGTVTIALASVTTATDGSFRFADTPTEGGQYTYTVQWPGDDASLPAEASHAVTVRGPLR